MDADDRLTDRLSPTTSTARSTRSSSPTRTACTRSPCGCSATPRDAEEAAQDALVAGLPGAGLVRPATDPRAAAARLADDDRPEPLSVGRRRAARPAGRGPSRSTATGPRPAVEPRGAHGAAPAEVAERHAERERWAARLAALPAAYRAAVVLRHVDGLSYPEVAAALGRPEGTVKAQVHRGIALLRTMLEAEARREPEEMTA